MYHAIRRGSKRHLNRRHSSALARSLSGTSSSLLGDFTQQMQSRHGLSGCRSLHLLSKSSYVGDFQQNFTLRQRFRELNLPATQSVPAFCKIDDEFSDDVDIAYCRRSSLSPAKCSMKISDPTNSFISLARTRTAYNFESRLLFSSSSGRKGTSARIPTPKTESAASSITSMDPIKIFKSGLDLTWYLTKVLVKFLVKLPGNTLYYMINSKERKAKIAWIKEIAKKEFDHYWTGTKLLMADVRTARSLFGKTLSGSTLTRRERKQLLRTVSDLFRLVPFSMFIIIPALEFVLPFALRLFPNMLPSTFQDSLKSEENMKRELKSRIAMAQFFQDTLEELAKEQKRIAGKRNNEEPDDEMSSKQIESAASMLEFLERSRNGEMMPPDVIIQYSAHFKDDLTLDNMPRMQLINMCKYMGIAPYGSNNFLRFQLRYKIRSLKEDDQRILWEGINSLTKMELREACQERGMRSTGLSKEAYKRSLQQWLDLSVNFNVPVSLLIMSRTYFLRDAITSAATSDDSKSVAGLADAISGLDKDVLNEVILEVATSEEKKSNPDVRKIKLEVLSHQNEMIREEQAERTKRKESAEKSKESAEKSEAIGAASSNEDSKQSSEGPQSKSRSSSDESTGESSTEIGVTEKDDKDTDKTATVKVPQDGADVEDEEEEIVHAELSADEIEAIEQLVSADPVSKERKDLARIKSAMKESEQESEEDTAEDEKEESEQSTVDLAEQVMDDSRPAAHTIESMEKTAEREADESTVFIIYKDGEEKVIDTSDVEEQSEIAEEEPEEQSREDIVVARLKKRIENMVDKIEIQLSKAEIQIGDKLHLLDKDNDGILSRDEIVESLQQVLKRQITSEEAEELANEMDADGDGVLTVQEFVSWLETNKLIKLESEGRDLDVDRILEGQNSEDEKTVEIKKQKQ